ncbi:hypothetical protein ASD04_00150 [Devosia sp. Root436]|nr:hypothetical protein ASD04_00150 [Devosia sp. Root436]
METRAEERAQVWLVHGAEVRSLSAPDDMIREIFGLALTGPDGLPSGVRERALKCSASYAAIRLISDIVGDLPVHVTRRLANGDKQRVRTHPAEILMNGQANGWTSGAELRRELTAEMLLEGSGYGVVLRNRGGKPVEVQQAKAKRSTDPATGAPVYAVPVHGGGERVVAYADMIEIRALLGIAPSTAAANATTLALLLERFGINLFGANGRPSGLLVFKSKVDATAANAARESWMADVKDSGVAVLGSDANYIPLAISSNDGQHIENRQFQTAEVLRFYGVTPTKAGELQDASLNNSESQARAFLADTLQPILTRWSDALSRCFLTSRERLDHSISFETKALVTADIKARFEAYAQAVGGPWITPNDARAADDMPRIDEGDKLNLPQGAAVRQENKE